MTQATLDASPRTRRIGLVLIPGHALMSAASAVEPFRAANLIAGRTLYELHMLSVGGGPVTSSAGSMFQTRALTESGPALDMVLVIAGGNPIGLRLPALVGWLRKLDARGVSLGGISGGAAILAEAGLMKGRRFTVHWDHFDALRDLSDDFLMERRLFVIDRDRLTCAGGVAALDMIHALITADHGVDLARQVGDWFIHTNIRPPGGAQRAGLVERYGTHHPAMIATIELMQSHIADPLDAGQLASLTGVSQRQLQRLFLQQFDRTLMDFYRALRLERAEDLLRQTHLTISEVAHTCGFSTLSHFTRAFGEEYGSSPSRRRDAYRTRS